jgi:cell division transport system permease protein
MAMLALAERAIGLLAVLLAAAVLLIIGNTIRLAVLNRQTEIEIIQLVGGTPAFVRRPFLYAGLWQGLLAGVAAWLLVELALLLLAGPVQELAGLYGSGFALIGLGAEEGLTLAGLGAGLGWLGSRLAVSWHLRHLSNR